MPALDNDFDHHSGGKPPMWAHLEGAQGLLDSPTSWTISLARMANYQVRGPFEVPVDQRPNGRMIDPGQLAAFWATHPAVARACGCYVFGIRAGRGITPVYVGKAAKTFRQECFTAHKLANHYNPALLDYRRGTPVIFFAIQTRARGRANGTEIIEVEKFLIEVAVSRNPNLSNVRGTKKAEWSIQGVVRGTRGARSESAKLFKKMMGI